MTVKMNNRIVLRAACREAANRFRSPSDMYKNDFTDSSMAVKNHPDDIKPFLQQLGLILNKRAFEHVGGIQAIMNRLPPLSPTYGYLCVYDFYKALKDAKYFAVERALKRITEFGQRKEGMKFTRKNARGHFTSACSPTMKAYTQSFCSEFNYNWRMILTLGSRLCVGNNRELVFKTSPGIPSFIDAKMISGCDNKFTVQVLGCAPEQAYAQMHAFLNATDPELFHYTFSGNTFVISVRSKQVPMPSFEVNDLIKTTPLSSEQKDFILTGDWVQTDNTKTAYFKIQQPEPVMIEDHYYSKMEESVNEMTIHIDNFDQQIDELEAKASKLRAQRSKLLHAMQALRS